MSVLTDRFGREHNTLRVSVTDRCNLRCQYCMPMEGIECSSRDALLTFEEITYAVDVACDLGIERVRITGGEPLLRKDLHELIRMLVEETDIEDLSLTTNGLLLERRIDALAEAGLNRVNVSIDSVQTHRFAQMTRFGRLEDALRGIIAAAEAGLAPIKVNALALEGFNDDEFDRWLDITRDFDVAIRFMEKMPIGEAAKNDDIGGFVDLTEVRKELTERHGLVPAETSIGNGPARYWKLPEAKGSLGFITPLSNPYCNSCSRMRLTSTGELRACLADDTEVSMAEAIRNRDRDGIAAAFRQSLFQKPEGHNWNDDEITHTSMSSLGG